MSDPLATDRHECTALMLALHKHKLCCANLLCPVSDPEQKDMTGQTALMWSARYGYVTCVSLLLPLSDAQARDQHGLTASSLATDNGHIHIADMINAYTLAMSDMEALHSSIALPSSPRKASPRRL